MYFYKVETKTGLLTLDRPSWLLSNSNSSWISSWDVSFSTGQLSKIKFDDAITIKFIITDKEQKYMVCYCSLNKSIQKVHKIVRIIGALRNLGWKQLLHVTWFKYNLLLKVASVIRSDQVSQLFTPCDLENLQRWRLH